MTPRAWHPADLLAGLADGRLRAADRDLVLAHLAGCPQCRDEYEAQSAVKGVLGGLPGPAAPDGLQARLAGLAAPGLAADPEPGRPHRAARPAHLRGRVALAGAAGAVVAVLGVTLVAGSAPVGQPVDPPVGRYVREHAASTLALPMAGSAAEALPAALVLPSGAGDAAGSDPAGSAARRVAGSATVVPGSDPRAVALVDAALAASDRVAYAGTLRITVGSGPATTTAWLDVIHAPRQGTAVSGATIGATYLAAGATAAGERTLGLLARSYRLTAAGAGVVAGRAAEVVEARRADGSTAARFWLDAATGLLLRRDTFAAGSTRSSAFERIRLDAPWLRHPPPMASVSLGPELVPAGGTLLPATAGEACRSCPEQLAGLRRYDARAVPLGDTTGVHLAYSDGIWTVSVFEQPGRLGADRPGGLQRATFGDRWVWVRSGLPDQVVWAADGVVYTVVADAPSQVLAAVVAALPHEPDPPSLALRLERGTARVLSWLDPTR